MIKTAKRRRPDKVYILTAVCCAFFCVGVVLGACSLNAADERLCSFLEETARQQILCSIKDDLPDILFATALPQVLVLLCCLVLATSALGALFLFLALLIKGAGVGLLFGYVFKAYRLKGLAYIALLSGPGAIIQAIALVMFCCEGAAVSSKLFSVMFSGDDTDLYRPANGLLTLFTKCSLALALGAVVQSALTASFGGVFL